MKTTDVVVRAARPADRPAIVHLLSEAGLPMAGIEDVWMTLVADRGGTVVATAALERYGPGEGHTRGGAGDRRRENGRGDGAAGAMGARAYLLRSVAVDPALRGMGIGATIVEAALDAADGDAKGVATVALLTESAVGYFDRFGFTPVDRSALPASLAASPELSGACPDSARAYMRRRGHPAG